MYPPRLAPLSRIANASLTLFSSLRASSWTQHLPPTLPAPADLSSPNVGLRDSVQETNSSLSTLPTRSSLSSTRSPRTFVHVAITSGIVRLSLLFVFQDEGVVGSRSRGSCNHKRVTSAGSSVHGASCWTERRKTVAFPTRSAPSTPWPAVCRNCNGRAFVPWT